MKLKMKRTLVLAVIVAAWSGNVLGENQSKAARLSDAELDNITAGSAFVVVGVHNPGRVPTNASGFNPTFHVFHCVNCDAIKPLPTTTGFLFVWKPGTSPNSEPFILRPIGNARL